MSFKFKNTFCYSPTSLQFNNYKYIVLQKVYYRFYNNIEQENGSP